MAILELYKVVIAIQAGIEGIGWFYIWNESGAAVIVVGRQPGRHIRGRGLGKVAVALPERFGMHERILGLKALGRGSQLEDSAIHHAADIGGSLIDVGDHFHHNS